MEDLSLENLPLYTSIEILNVLNLDEVLSKMTLQLKLTIQWTDSRLQYYHLKGWAGKKRFLSYEEIEKVWVPVLIFTNTKNRQEANFRNKSTSAQIVINEGKFY